MSPAVVMNYVTTAVIAEVNDEKVQQAAIGDEYIGMGKIMARFEERELGCGVSGGLSGMKRMRHEEEKEWNLSDER
ncbi:hypothetical protein E4U17_005824 [Claviceps sp. LM77 group G4]|nr:hypothetical protein E4U17_005824 [Claviceps sp. LM77 group G4]KAG6064646.1 hypothetical protein E4U33_006067 [Claviceps sp. LM78 group G4]